MNQLFKDMASVQYGDYEGSVGIDGHDGPFLHGLAKTLKIDSSRFFPFAFRIEDSTTDGIDLKDQVSLTIFMVNKEAVGNNFDEIETYCKRNGGKLPVTEYQTYLSYPELFKHFKRLSIFAVQNGLADFVTEFETEDTIEEE